MVGRLPLWLDVWVNACRLQRAVARQELRAPHLLATEILVAHIRQVRVRTGHGSGVLAAHLRW